MSTSMMEEAKRRAVDAVMGRFHELVQIYENVQGSTFEAGQQLFLRWSDATKQTLSDYISEEDEAERFEAVTSLHTYESLDQYFHEYSAYLEGLLHTLKTNPKQLLRERQPEAIAPPDPTSKTSNEQVTKYERFDKWWKNKTAIVGAVVLFSALVAMAVGATGIHKALETFFPPFDQSTSSSWKPTIAPDRKTTYLLYVKSEDDGTPVPGAKVVLQGVASAVPEFADSLGLVRFEFPEQSLPTKIKIVVEARAYDRYEQTRETKFEPGRDVTQEIRLHRETEKPQKQAGQSADVTGNAPPPSGVQIKQLEEIARALSLLLGDPARYPGNRNFRLTEYLLPEYGAFSVAYYRIRDELGGEFGINRLPATVRPVIEAFLKRVGAYLATAQAFDKLAAEVTDRALAQVDPSNTYRPFHDMCAVRVKLTVLLGAEEQSIATTLSNMFRIGAEGNDKKVAAIALQDNSLRQRADEVKEQASQLSLKDIRGLYDAIDKYLKNP